MHKSVWEIGTETPKFESLTKNAKTDVLIIGGGLCGILCAYYLQNAGVDYILVEGARILSGITKNTTAKITSQHGLIYSKLIESLGKELAQMYLTANQNAIERYAQLCQNIDCDFERKDAFTYSTTDTSKIEREVNAVNSLGLGADFADTAELPFKTRGAIRFASQAQFNPVKFAAHIAQNLNIYENTYVYELAPSAAHTRSSVIKANKFIITTHFPFINKHGSYFLKLYQHRSYVAAYSNAATLQGMYVDDDKKGMSFRTYKDLLFIGGSGHRTGKRSNAWSALHSHADKYYPDAQLKYEWAAQDCMSLDGIPYIGQYSKNTPDVYVASGFNKWGITSSMAAAQILTDMVQGVKNDCAEVFSPQRSILKPQLAVNGIQATLNLITPTTKRCPHLGCALKWNKAEHTWDCPCHGSRFEQNGKLIDNPARRDADIRG